MKQEIELGKTYSGKTVIGLDGSWVKYDEGNGWQGECMRETFILRYVSEELKNIGTTESPSVAEAVTGLKETTP